MKCIQKIILIIAVFSVFAVLGSNSQSAKSSGMNSFDLQDCLNYALTYSPMLQQSRIDKDITDQTVKSRVSQWFPQINANATLQHYFQTPVFLLNTGQAMRSGAVDNNPYSLQLNQVLFNPDAWLASNTAGKYRKQAELEYVNQYINMVVATTKSFYAVLLNRKQIEVYQADVERLKQGLKDSQSQYESGVVDKTDVKRAGISLNNSLAALQQSRQLLNASYANLKAVIGYNEPVELQIHVDTAVLAQYESRTDFLADTVMPLPQMENRVEYQMLKVRQELEKSNLAYERLWYVPSISLFASYNPTFLSQDFSDLYKEYYPNSLIGVTLSVPIFDGLKRKRQTNLAKLNLKRTEWDFLDLENNVNAEYVQAMSIYKSNLENLRFLKINKDEAEEVYNVIKLQYNEGVKTYLDVTTAQTDLLTAQISFYNALFQVLSSRIDVQKSIGAIK